LCYHYFDGEIKLTKNVNVRFFFRVLSQSVHSLFGYISILLFVLPFVLIFRCTNDDYLINIAI
jgi:hypothetical protein